VILTFSLAPVSVPNRHCRGPLRHSRGLLQGPVHLLEARNIVLGRDMRIARGYATLSGRIRIMGTCGAVLVKCGVCGRAHRLAREHHYGTAILVWLALSSRRVRVRGERHAPQRTRENYR